MSPVRIDRALASVDAQHDPRSAAHGQQMVKCITGKFRRLERDYPDDPALAAEDVLDALRRISPIIAKLAEWAEDTAHQSFAPAPERGATIE